MPQGQSVCTASSRTGARHFRASMTQARRKSGRRQGAIQPREHTDNFMEQRSTASISHRSTRNGMKIESEEHQTNLGPGFCPPFAREPVAATFWFPVPDVFVCFRADAFLGPEQRYRLQKVSSNSTSVSAGFGRCTPSCVVKRILSAYLFALISGTKWCSRFSRIRTIWATRPAIICW